MQRRLNTEAQQRAGVVIGARHTTKMAWACPGHSHTATRHGGHQTPEETQARKTCEPGHCRTDG